VEDRFWEGYEAKQTVEGADERGRRRAREQTNVRIQANTIEGLQSKGIMLHAQYRWATRTVIAANVMTGYARHDRKKVLIGYARHVDGPV
jgi:hypothetical protein